MKINVDLYCQSTAEHLTQIFTGFTLLSKHNLITLQIHKDTKFSAGVMGKPVLRAIINHKYKLVYDTFDGGQFFQEDLDWCDFYFKRSYSRNIEVEKGLSQKIFPLGFNYSVYADNGNLAILKLVWNIKKGISKENLLPFIRSDLLLSYLFRLSSSNKYASRISCFENYPVVTDNPMILFMTRLWEPSGRRDEEDRREINKMRGECIRSLRDRFGDQFVGGLYPTPDAQSQYPDIVLTKHEEKKARYLELLKKAHICIATRGLLGSNGWKIAEYIAGAKAIVSEPLVYDVPGEFTPGKNYLEFTSPQECVEKVRLLVDNYELRYSLMKNNFYYYHSYLKPDILVWNTLQLTMIKRNEEQKTVYKIP